MIMFMSGALKFQLPYTGFQMRICEEAFSILYAMRMCTVCMSFIRNLQSMCELKLAILQPPKSLAFETRYIMLRWLVLYVLYSG